MKTKLKVSAVVLMTGAALGCVTGLSLSCTRQRESALKPIDQAALQTMVDTTAKELMVPGAMILLPTPQGEFTVSYGTTLLGTTSPPNEDTHFRIASNTKTMTAAVIVVAMDQQHARSRHTRIATRLHDAAGTYTTRFGFIERKPLMMTERVSLRTVPGNLKPVPVQF